MRDDFEVRAEPIKEWECLKVKDLPPVNLLKEFYDRKDSNSFRQLQVGIPSNRRHENNTGIRFLDCRSVQSLQEVLAAGRPDRRNSSLRTIN
jgi:hypothetical protein